MADVTMPRLSDTMEEGTIATWLKKPGEQVKKGDVIAQIETDKATMDLTAFEGGTLQEILAPEGATVAIGKPVARIGAGPAPAQSSRTTPPATQSASDSGAAPSPAQSSGTTPSVTRSASGSGDGAAPTGDAAAPRARPLAATPTPDASGASPAAQTDTAAAPVGQNAAGQNATAGQNAAAQNATAQTEATIGIPRTETRVADPKGDAPVNGKTRASPMARHIAAEHGVDLARVSGSGPQGRVIRADVEAALAARPGEAAAPAEPERAPAVEPEDADDERVPLSQLRRTVARRMAESTRTVPHFFLTITVDATEMVKLRRQILDQLGDSGIKISFNDLIVKAVALALRKVPDVNVSFADDSLIRHKRINIGIAVATERGLIVPVLRDVDQQSIGSIAQHTRDLAERANAGKLQPADYSGGTFTISNLGMFGVEQFNAVINPPEAAILAVGTITREPVELDGQITVRERLKLTLSVDHRALDGAIGARYLQALKQILEKPMLLLV